MFVCLRCTKPQQIYMNKIEWVAQNSKHGDLTRCASAYKYDIGYLREVSKGRRNNIDMLDTLIGFIKEMRAIDKTPTVNDELLGEAKTSTPTFTA